MSEVPLLLIVDDDVSTVMLLSRTLEGLGDIAFANCGSEALALRGTLQPDLILLDAEMPGMDGFATCAAFKEDPDYADVPILFLTAHTDIEAETRALGIGAVDFIGKPVSPPSVRARVRTHLSLKQKTDELRRLTTIDPLTGIPNRRAFDDWLDREWRRAVRADLPLSLLLIDVDFFKRYNDHYGHLAGDGCLRQVAQALASTVHRPGDLVARYGGEEFAALLPQTPLDAALAMGHRFCRNVRALGIAHETSEADIVVTVSVGASSTFNPAHIANNESLRNAQGSVMSAAIKAGQHRLIGLADDALYATKAAGRNGVTARELKI